MRWLSSAGGPFVLLPYGLVHEWHGIMRNGSDYRLACTVNGYAGLIAWRDRQVLVLNDEPLDTTIYVEPGRTMVLRWIYAPDASAIAAELPKLRTSEIPAGDVLELEVGSEPLILFDAAAEGARVTDTLSLSLEPGGYHIVSHIYAPNDELALVVHDFCKA